jgi:ubiquinone/menaquinone biosynthesis C-methylase UbiE
MYEKVDKAAHDEFYRNRTNCLESKISPEEYIRLYEAKELAPFYQGGSTKGYVRSLTVNRLISASNSTGKMLRGITVLDAGCGQGGLSVYLAAKGFNVIGVDISPVACRNAKRLAEAVGVQSWCSFHAEDLGKLTLSDEAVDFIIGHASLHHFIKYDGVPSEFSRVLISGGMGFFADSYGENKLYHLFHDKEKMCRLGDVILSKNLIGAYFKDHFEIHLAPTDWFTMLGKLYLRIFPNRWNTFLRRLSFIHYHIDRLIPTSSRIALFLAGAVMTTIIKR